MLMVIVTSLCHVESMPVVHERNGGADVQMGMLQRATMPEKGLASQHAQCELLWCYIEPTSPSVAADVRVEKLFKHSADRSFRSHVSNPEIDPPQRTFV